MYLSLGLSTALKGLQDFLLCVCLEECSFNILRERQSEPVSGGG